MESLAYLYLILANDFPEKNWQLIENRQKQSFYSLFFRGSKLAFLPLFIFFSLAIANLRAIALTENPSPATSTFTESYNADTYIYLGDKGEQIKLLQEALKATGYYNGQITGVVDQATVNAIKQFQQANNITPDGIVGAVTKAELLQKSGITNLTPTNLPAPTSVVKRGDSGNSVRWVQEKLKIAGYLKGNITGFFGISTETAVKQFQQSRKLTADGIVGANTRNALSKVSSQRPPTTTSSTVPTGVLRKGDSGSSVRWVQEKLKIKGFFNHEITGVFGELTESAVKKFQQAKKLTADGIVGTITRNALAQNTSQTSSSTTSSIPTNIVKKGDSGSSVRWVQEKLKIKGFFKSEITGVFGNTTETAVKQFQQSRKLTADGIVGTKTRNALQQSATQTSTTTKKSSTINPSQGVLKLGDSGNEVKWLQEKLTQLKVYNGPVTGFFGNLTEASVKKFQTSKRLTADGIVGRNTQIAINDEISKL